MEITTICSVEFRSLSRYRSRRSGRGEARFIFERAFTLGNEARIKTLRVIGNFAEGGGKNLMFSFDRVSELWVADMGFR